MALSSGGVLDAIIDKFTDVIEFQTTLGVYRISKNQQNSYYPGGIYA
ncbi:hypothetical protein LAD77_23995 [Klebsiella pneumoniae]|nr:hypothetical protein [Klebsiella pneumoniae]